MGDVGSTLLGYNIAVFAIYYQNGSFHENEDTSILVWVILFGLFCFDATYTLLRRYKNCEKLSFVHKKHAYQRLTQSGWAHDKVVLYSICVNILLFCIVYYISNTLVAFFVAFAFLYMIMKFVDSKKRFE